MVLATLSLQNFRNFKKRNFKFSPKMTIIVGPNTSGKTNILEAIYMLATGKSFRAELEREVISYEEEIARINGVTNFLLRQQNNDRRELVSLSSGNKMNFVTPNPVTPESTELEILITTGSVGGKKVPKKKFLVNKVKKRLTDFIGNFFAVLFSPQDLQIVTDSPSLRRKYLDSVLCCVDKEYRRASLVYEKGLRQRNRILERIREKRASSPQLEYWDKLLVGNGGMITKKREEFIKFVNNQFRALNRQKATEGHKEPRSHLFVTKEVFGSFEVVYEKNQISQERLKDYQEKELVLGMTLVGPHRDDFVVTLQATSYPGNAEDLRRSLDTLDSSRVIGPRSKHRDKLQADGKDLSIYGSRGEQRLAILWLKLCELSFLEEKTGEKPVLLLDDIFSELDQDYQGLVTKIIPNQQTIITTTDEKVVKGGFLKEAKVIRLNTG